MLPKIKEKCFLFFILLFPLHFHWQHFVMDQQVVIFYSEPKPQIKFTYARRQQKGKDGKLV